MQPRGWRSRGGTSPSLLHQPMGTASPAQTARQGSEPRRTVGDRQQATIGGSGAVGGEEAIEVRLRRGGVANRDGDDRGRRGCGELRWSSWWVRRWVRDGYATDPSDPE